jgi:hypothetical protein
MFSIQVPLNAKDMPAQMGAMRDCLDANGIEAAGFSYRKRTAFLIFRAPQDAKIFSEQFALRKEALRKRA